MTAPSLPLRLSSRHAEYPVLGVDPGAEGGAVLLDVDGRTVLDWWLWRPRDRKDEARGWALWGHGWADWTEHVSLSELGDEIAEDVDRQLEAGLVSLVVEGLFVPRPRDGLTCWRGQRETEAYLGRVRSTLTLAENTAELMGPLRAAAVEIHRPKASTWRAAVLGLPRNVASDVAERTAIALCRATLRGLEEVEHPHLAEAACMAKWGWVQQVGVGR